MPSLSSFINSSQYSKESTTNPLLAGMVLGTSYNSGFTFNGVSGAAGSDPGGLFGWLIYSRSVAWTQNVNAKGFTSDKYIVYTNPQDLVGDLNQLSGITSCLLTTPGAGGTYALFQTAGTQQNIVRLSALTPGYDFLHAINYLAYGGTLVIAGAQTGFDQYITDKQQYFDVVIGKEGTTAMCQWLINQPYTVGIFPSIADNSGSTGITGNGYTAANYAVLFGNTSYVTGTTVANRIFNVYGLKTATDIDTTTLLTNSKITYTLPAVGDVGGFFTRSKNRNEQYLTVAGIDRSTILNGNIVNSIDWTNSLKNTLKTNRVNFFVNYNPKFLGSDLVGATASSTIASDDRIGPSRLRSALTQSLNNIGLKYLYDINNATTRGKITAEIQTAIDPFSAYIDTTQTQIICDASNNTDNSSTLTMSVVIKPVLSIDSFGITVTLTQ
jgi:hypothetical protein